MTRYGVSVVPDEIRVPSDAGQWADGLREILRRIPARRGRYIDVGPGWYAIIVNLDRDLAHIDPDYTVQQVKEKLGGLRYYYATERVDLRPAMDRLVRGAEAAADRTCEITGNAGVLMIRSGQYKTIDPAIAPEGSVRADQ